ncbi:Bifunctional xylanase/deacetylase [bacterium HR12]|nr:Bifunctional xylanase/deacetylase [bacterium HR12]
MLLGADLADLPAPLRISVQGRPTMVAAGTTVRALLRDLWIAPRPGRLLSVTGRVLERRADPGLVLLNGTPADPDTRLATGDAIALADGVDRVEGTRRETRILPGRQLHNPAFTLELSRLREIRTVGEISGETVDVRYRPLGGSVRPRAVALTFDDGPWPGTTLRIVRTLRRMRAPATFFMVGYLMERYPEIVERVARAGMTIGTHSWSHPWRVPFVKLRPHRIETEVRRPAELLAERFGIRPTLFRPPGGSFDPSVIRVAREAGMRVVHWSVDPRDYRTGRPAAIAREVLARVRRGSIVLLHDGGGDGEATLRALPRIIRGIRRMGLELIAIPG